MKDTSVDSLILCQVCYEVDSVQCLSPGKRNSENNLLLWQLYRPRLHTAGGRRCLGRVTGSISYWSHNLWTSSNSSLNWSSVQNLTSWASTNSAASNIPLIVNDVNCSDLFSCSSSPNNFRLIFIPSSVTPSRKRLSMRVALVPETHLVQCYSYLSGCLELLYTDSEWMSTWILGKAILLDRLPW